MKNIQVEQKCFDKMNVAENNISLNKYKIQNIN